MTRIIIFIFMLTIGWTGLIILQEWIRPFTLVCILILGHSVIRLFQTNKFRYKVFDIRDFILLIFILYVIVLGIFLPNPKTYNYILAYSFIFFLLYSMTKYYLVSNINLRTILKYNYYGVSFVIAFSIVEILVTNIIGVNLIHLLWENRANGAIATVGSHSFIRSYGLMPEPGIFGLYLNSLGILGLYYTYNNHHKIRRRCFYLFFAISYYFINSAAALGSLIFAFIIIQILLFYQKKTYMINIFIIVLFIATVSLLIFKGNILLFNKMLRPDIYSVERYDKWLLALNMILDMNLFGKGLGYISFTYGSSFNNWYFMVLIETGIIGLVLILLFIIISIKKSIHFSKYSSKVYLIGILSNVFHFVAISTFFNPFLFIVISIMDVENYQRKNKFFDFSS
jgi:hypothetical protein